MTSSAHLVPLRPHRSRGLRVRVAGAAAVLAMTLGATAVASSAYGETDEASAPVLHLTAGANGVVSGGLPTTASVTVHNDAETALAPGDVLIELNRTPLIDDDDVAAWLADGEAEGSFDAIGSDSMTAVDAGARATASIIVPQDLLADLAPGVYPLRAELTAAADSAEATSVLVIATDARPQVTVFVPITATPADSAALLSADELTELTAADGDLTAQLDGVSGTSAVLGVDPAIVAAIRVLGTAAPSTAIDWLDRLENLSNQRFALQLGDADPTTQAQADLPSALAPTTLRTFLDPAHFAANGSATIAPTPSPAPADDPVLPDDVALTAISGAEEDLLWPRPDVTAEDLAEMRSYTPGGAEVILSTSAFEGDAPSHAVVADGQVLVTDAEASDALSDAAAEPDADARTRSLAAANAYLFLEAQVSGTPLAVGLDRDETRTAAALRAAVATADTPGVDLTSLRAVPASAATLKAESSDDRSPALHALLDDERALSQFATVLDDPQMLLASERIRIMRTIRVGLGSTKAEDALIAHREATRTTLDAVGIQESSAIQLLTANADLPFAVRNDLPWPVNVVLSAAPNDPRLEVQRVTTATIPAGTTTRVKVPVSARVGSGELDLRLSLASPTGVPLGDQQSVRVAVRAEWEGIGLAVFGGLIVVLLVLGVVRTILRRRGADAGENPDAGAEEAGTASDPSTSEEST
ncbi:DUF6049 family protein [Microbacterium sp.]|uniref:DUF6049 family protein n=1 Tax=Microbacterium sp. TaxID=51671 RepID=UPI0039E3E039